MRPEIEARKQRWKLLNEFEIAELRATPMKVKLQQLAALMASVDFFGWRSALEEDDLAGWDRWQKLRHAYPQLAKRKAEG